jgi:hypothetical protein
MAVTFVAMRLAGKFPFPDILRSEQKVALYTANKIGRLLLTVRNAHFRLSTSRIFFSQIVLRSAYPFRCGSARVAVGRNNCFSGGTPKLQFSVYK